MKRLAALFSLVLTGCGTMNTARALRPGEHELGLTFGGPIITAPIPTPLPSLVVEGRIGLPELAKRPNDIRFGSDVTAAAFGTLEAHVGWTWQFVLPEKARPAVAVTNVVYGASNFADWTKDPEARTAWGVWHVEGTVSWDVGRHIAYGGLAEYLDFTDPDLLLTPFIGFEFDAKKARVQIEVRWYAINQVYDRDDVDWLSPGVGAIGLVLGVAIPVRGGT